MEIDLDNFVKVDQRKARGRISHGILLDQIGGSAYIDLESSVLGLDSNYLLIVNDDTNLNIAIGSPFVEDPLPEHTDFFRVAPHGHYEVQGSMFNKKLRVYIQGNGRVTLVY